MQCSPLDRLLVVVWQNVDVEKYKVAYIVTGNSGIEEIKAKLIYT